MSVLELVPHCTETGSVLDIDVASACEEYVPVVWDHPSVVIVYSIFSDYSSIVWSSITWISIDLQVAFVCEALWISGSARLDTILVGDHAG